MLLHQSGASVLVREHIEKRGEETSLPCAVILDNWSFGRGSGSSAGARRLGGSAGRGRWSASCDWLLDVLSR